MEFIDFKKTYISANNGQLFCHAYGDDKKTPVIVIHGGPGLGFHYLMPHMRALARFSYAIFYDQRGTGDSISADDWQLHPFETYSNDIDKIREAFGFDRVTLVAHSFGGIFASFYATTFSQHVNKIVYINSVPLSSKDYLDYIPHRMSIVDENKTKLDELKNTAAFLRGDSKAIETYYRIYFKNFFVNPDLVNQLSLTMTSDAALNNFKIYDFFYHYIKNHSFDLWKPLKILNKPSLIITGKDDVIPSHYMKDFHASIPLSQYLEIEHCGHFPYIEQPALLFDAIHSFMML